MSNSIPTHKARERRRLDRGPRPEDFQHVSYWDERYRQEYKDALTAADAAAGTAQAPVEGGGVHVERDDEINGAAADGAQCTTRPPDVALPDFDWIHDFSGIRKFLSRYLPPIPTAAIAAIAAAAADDDSAPARDLSLLPQPTLSPSLQPLILHLGCGNSILPAGLHSLGYRRQVCVDFSEYLIAAMKRKYAVLETGYGDGNDGNANSLRWLVADVRDLAPAGFADASVDAAIDKATLDGMLHGSLWNPPADVRANVGRYVDEVARVLQPGARWLYVTWRQPHFLAPLLRRDAYWSDMRHETLEGDGGGTFDHFGWIMTRNERPFERPGPESTSGQDL